MYFLFQGNKVVLEVDGNGNQFARNVYGTNLISRNVDGKTANYFYNGHGDVTKLLDVKGNQLASYYYDAFGNITDSTGTIDNPYRYAGYQYDSETGTYYVMARMYDPAIGRFMQEDTYRGNPSDPLSLNLYTYCDYEPIMHDDPTGHFANGLFGAVTGLINKVVSTICNALSGVENAVSNAVSNAYTTVASKAAITASSIKSEAKSIMEGIKSSLPAIGSKIVNGIAKGISCIASNETVRGIGNDLVTGIKNVKRGYDVINDPVEKATHLSVIDWAMIITPGLEELELGKMALKGLDIIEAANDVSKAEKLGEGSLKLLEGAEDLGKIAGEAEEKTPGLIMNLQLFAKDGVAKPDFIAAPGGVIVKGEDYINDFSRMLPNGESNAFTRNLEHVDDLVPKSFGNLKNNGVIKVNSSGSDRPLESIANSYNTTSKGEQVFVYDQNGKLIYDLSKERVKSFNINVNPAGKEFYKPYKL